MVRSRSLSGLLVVTVASALLLLYARWREQAPGPSSDTFASAGPGMLGGPAVPDDPGARAPTGAPDIAATETPPNWAAFDAVDRQGLGRLLPPSARSAGMSDERSRELAGDMTAAGPDLGGDRSGGDRSDRALRRLVERWRVVGVDPHPLWADVLAALADPLACPRYAGMPPIAAMADLLPLSARPDARTGLFVFCLVGTGEPPTRDDESGELDLAGSSAVVLVLVPGGQGLMGADPARDEQAEPGEQPAHEVSLSPYYLALTETTRAQWQVLQGQALETVAGMGVDGQLPVTDVSHGEASALLGEWGLALPTEAQWEFAARAGTTTRFCTGDDAAEALAVAWVDENALGELQPVASAEGPNDFGLFDLHGNAWELCRDGYSAYGSAPVHDPRGPDGSPVIRGGSCDDLIWSARSSARDSVEPGDRFANLGFRVVRRALP